MRSAVGRPPRVPRRPRQPDWRGPVGEFLESYTRDLKGKDFRRLFLRETPEAYRFFVKEGDERSLAALPWHVRLAARIRLLFVAFTSRLSPARRAIYGIAVLLAALGTLQMFQGVRLIELPTVPFIGPRVVVPGLAWQNGTFWLVSSFLLMNLLVLLEVADRLTLKRDLEIAREIQLAMLPREMVTNGGLEAYGFTRPANTVGGDFYDVLPTPDGRLVLALGDVAGKGSPAALLMALTLAILRTLVDEGLTPTELMQRLNVQVSRHAPASRFVTMCLSVFDSTTGALTYVNAGQTPPLLRRSTGVVERLTEGGVALGMFELAAYTAGQTRLAPGDVLVFYSDGITEAENQGGIPFDEGGLLAVLSRHWWEDAATIGKGIVSAVEAHAAETRLADDLTVLAIRRPIPLPGV